MSIYQSDHAKGVKVVPTPSRSNEAVVVKFSYTFGTTVVAVSTGAASNGDKVELGILPAGMTITDAIVVTDDVTSGGALNIGFMSGEPGSVDNARTCGTELFAALADTTAVNRLSTAAPFRLASNDNADRSIGLYFTTAASNGTAGRTVDLIVTMVNDSQD
jgi:hypothetical protein